MTDARSLPKYATEFVAWWDLWDSPVWDDGFARLYAGEFARVSRSLAMELCDRLSLDQTSLPQWCGAGLISVEGESYSLTIGGADLISTVRAMPPVEPDPDMVNCEACQDTGEIPVIGSFTNPCGACSGRDASPPDWAEVAPGRGLKRFSGWHGVSHFVVRCPGPPSMSRGDVVVSKTKAVLRARRGEGVEVDLGCEHETTGQDPVKVLVHGRMFDARAFAAFRSRCVSARLLDVMGQEEWSGRVLRTGGLVGLDAQGVECAMLMGFGAVASATEPEPEPEPVHDLNPVGS